MRAGHGLLSAGGQQHTHRAVGEGLLEQPEGGGDGQQAACAQRGVTVAYQVVVLDTAGGVVGGRRSECVQMPLEADQRGGFQTGCGREVAAEVPMVVCLHRAASAAQEVRQVGGQCLFLAGRVGDGEEGKKGFCDLTDDLGGVHRGDSSLFRVGSSIIADFRLGEKVEI